MRGWVIVGSMSILGLARPALAQQGLVPTRTGPPPATSAPAAQLGSPSGADEPTARGRAAFARGQRLSRDEQWGDALAAFEEAAAARDAPLVEFSIGYCQRALGRYVAAKRTFHDVVANPAGLDPSQVSDAKAYLNEFDTVIVSVDVKLEPASAALTVDGRPLEGTSDPGTYLAGVAPAGASVSLGKSALTISLDPGAHLFRASREGHQDAVVPKSYRAGEHATLDLHLDILPATVAIRSEPGSAIVRIDSREVGVAPIELQRPAGQYKLEVVLDHYDTYKASLDLAAGQHADLTARLNPYKVPLTKRWWFWTGAVGVVAGGAILTYFLTRSTPQPPPYDGGSQNLVVQARSLHW